MEKKITIPGILTNGFAIGIQNAASLLGAIVLWMLTFWIPYINVGTTIALATLPIEMSKGKVFSPLCIFDKKYFSFMGEFFLTAGFIYIGMLIGTIFLFIPAIVISLAWGLAIYLLIDKGLNPMQALVASNKMTMGYKWIIFGAQIILAVAVVLLNLLFGLIPFVGVVLSILLVIITMAVSMGFQAYIYKELSAEKPAEE